MKSPDDKKQWHDEAILPGSLDSISTLDVRLQAPGRLQADVYARRVRLAAALIQVPREKRMRQPDWILKNGDKASSPSVFPYGHASDESLVKACLEGDSGAFGQLFHRYQKQILSLCMKMTRGDESHASDLCQETFISAYDHLSQLKEPKNFFYWALGIAKNKCISHARQQARLYKMLGDYEVIGKMISKNDGRWTEVELQLVETIIKGIKDPELRKTIELFYIEGRKIPDIAKIQGLTQTAITTRLNRFRVKFRKRIVREILK